MRQTQLHEHKIMAPLEERWSPRAFDPQRSLSEEDALRLFEAARWSPSGYNAQPWRYIYALREEKGAFSDMLEVLYPMNQAWAQEASMLILSIARKDFEGREGENRFAYYDAGAANMALVMQASSMDLYVRQMGGYDKAKARAKFELADNYDPLAMMAVGFLSPQMKEKEKEGIRGRQRLPLESIVSHHKG